jgi:MinD-like ATPase involved in chromosome partitioning or flagellar assembly
MTIVCEPSPEQATSLAGYLPGSVRPVTDILSVSDALSADPAETVVVLGAGVELSQALDFTSWLRQQRPGVGVILLRTILDVNDVLAAMRAGVREVLAADDGAALAEACRRFQHQFNVAPPPAGPPGPGGNVVTVFSAKGGCGKTTLATNLSVVLARAGQRVCLVDFDLTFGDIAITLGLTPKRSIADLATLGDELDEAKVATLVTPYQPNLDCVLAPVVPGEAERIPVTSTAAMVDVLSGMYDYVLIDTPAQVTEHVLAALDASHQHILLTAPEIPALKNLRVTLDMLDLLSYDRAGRTIVLNRSDAQVGLTEADIERVVRNPIAGHIPSSRDVTVSINRGQPLAAALPDHPVSLAIRQFVAEHVHQAAPAASPAASRRGLRLRRR